LKNQQPQGGDSLVVSQNGNYFSGTIIDGQQEDPQNKKQVYHVVVTEVYPDLKTGRVSNSVCIGDTLQVTTPQIKHVHTEEVDNIRPDICLTIENGMIAFAKRTDGQNKDIIIKIIDEDDGTTKMFTTNTHSFVQIHSTVNENSALI